jgi:hypothetical protein
MSYNRPHETPQLRRSFLDSSEDFATRWPASSSNTASTYDGIPKTYLSIQQIAQIRLRSGPDFQALAIAIHDTDDPLSDHRITCTICCQPYYTSHEATEEDNSAGNYFANFTPTSPIRSANAGARVAEPLRASISQPPTSASATATAQYPGPSSASPTLMLVENSAVAPHSGVTTPSSGSVIENILERDDVFEEPEITPCGHIFGAS